jgi:hypothetical protein
MEMSGIVGDGGKKMRKKRELGFEGHDNKRIPLIPLISYSTISTHHIE